MYLRTSSSFQIVQDKNGGSTSRSRCYHPSLTLYRPVRYHVARLCILCRQGLPSHTLFPLILLLIVCLQFVASKYIALTGIFTQRRLHECCPKAALFAQRSTIYRASVTLLEPALHTINIKCDGDFPGAAQEWLGSLNDQSFIVLCTAALQLFQNPRCILL